MLCGGRVGGSSYHRDCYLLSNLGVWLSSPIIALMILITERYLAAAVLFDSGWWVIGGYNVAYLDTSEVWYEHNKTWVPSINIPEAVNGQCVVTLNTTHLFMAGGQTARSAYSASVYIYSRAEGFVP